MSKITHKGGLFITKFTLIKIIGNTNSTYSKRNQTTNRFINPKKYHMKGEPMMQSKSKPAKNKNDTNTSRFAKRIGSVTYMVGVHFKKDATETMDKKIMRLIKNEMGEAV